MEKKLILEEIERIKLLSGYKNKLTLTENQLFLETAPSTSSHLLVTLAQKGSQDVQKLEQKLLDSIRNTPHTFTNSNGVKLKTANEILHAAENGLLHKTQMGNLIYGVLGDLKNDTSTAAKDIKNLIINDMLNPNHIDKIEEKFLKSGGKWHTYDQAMAELTKSHFSKEDAETFLKKYEDLNRKKLKGSPHGGSPIITQPVPTITVVPIITATPKPTWWERMWGNKTFKYALAAAAGAGIYQLLSWWMGGGKDDKEVQWIPGCLKIVNNGNFTIQDLEKLSKSRTVDSFPMSSPVVKDMASKRETTMSDVEIKKDGTYTSSKGNGEWQAQGDKVIFNQGGNVFYIDCSDKTEVVPPVPVPPVPVPDPSGCGSFTPCSKFPFRKCCEAKEIQDVQKCLGISADGKFGSQTERALGKSYLTRSEYDGIMRDCEGNTTKQTTIAPERNIYGSEEP